MVREKGCRLDKPGTLSEFLLSDFSGSEGTGRGTGKRPEMQKAELSGSAFCLVLL